jgi:hypothetical protein
MTNRTAQQDRPSERIVSIEVLQAADALRRRGDIRKGGLKALIRELIERWDQSMLPPGEEFRTDESVHEQHFRESLRQREWRVPYGVNGYAGWQLMRARQRTHQHD